MMRSQQSRVLCVDDDFQTCELVSLYLTDPQVEVVSAHSAADALRRAGSERFDLYLLDLRLPDGSGIELCQRLHALAPFTPIIFISAAARDEEVSAGLAAGAVAYFTKPFDFDALRRTVMQALEGKAPMLS